MRKVKVTTIIYRINKTRFGSFFVYRRQSRDRFRIIVFSLIKCMRGVKVTAIVYRMNKTRFGSFFVYRRQLRDRFRIHRHIKTHLPF